MFINLGNDYKLNDKTRFSFEFEKTFFGDLNVDWSANANLRYRNIAKKSLFLC